MSGKAIIPLVAGLCVGGLALKLGLNSLQQAKGGQVAMVAVCSAKTDIARGTAIDDTMLDTVQFPAQSIPQGVFKKKEELIGRVVGAFAPAGLPVLESMLLPPGAKPGIYVPPGFRAVAVKVDESSAVDYHVQPGAFVDVVGYFNVRRGRNQEISARTLVENVEVLAVGQKISVGNSEADKASKSATSTNNKPARAVTLKVKPDDAKTLLLAEQRGKIKLSLRNESDEGGGAGASKSVSESDLLGEAPAEEKPQERSAKAKSQNQQGGWLAAIFGGARSTPGDGAAAAAKAPPPLPTFAYTMKVTNGNRTAKLGWNSLTSIEPTEIASLIDRKVGGAAAQRPLPPPARTAAPNTGQATDATRWPKAAATPNGLIPPDDEQTRPAKPQPNEDPDSEPDDEDPDHDPEELPE